MTSLCWKRYCGFSKTGAQWHMQNIAESILLSARDPP